MHTLKKNANNNKLAESRKARSINEDEWSTDVKKFLSFYKFESMQYCMEALVIRSFRIHSSR